MGASSSVLLTEENSKVIEEDQFNSQRNVSNRSTRKKNQQVFERSTSIMSNTDMIDELDGDEVSPDMREILVKALSGFLFLQSGMIKDNPKLNLLIKGMKQESFSTGHNVITEGESGYKLYVIESGEVEVTINGTIIRDLNRGCLLGELALLYDAPRSATVKCKNNCVLWSLTRDIFKRIQTISATANQIQRARWLVASPELACLSAVDLSRLVGTLQIIEFEQGSTVFTEGEITNQIILIENGHCSISIKGDSVKATDKDYKMIDKKLNILRPMGSKKRMSFDHMNNSQLKSFLRDSNPDTILISSENGSTSMSHPPNTVCEVSEGCIVGIGALRGKAQMTNETCWKWMKHEKVEGAISPLTMTALTPITCAVFSVEIFENLFGPIVEVLKKYGSKNVLTGEVEMEKPNTKEMIFDSSKFKQKYILGSGSFGVVTLGEYRAEKNSSAPPMLCALKALSKLAVIETGQLRHVLDERRLLAYMDSPFVMKLYGTYQTPHTLVMVSEPLNCGDLWSIIYETPPFSENNGLPFELATFYATCLVWGLSHIHEKGVVYRDLKPENIMLDDKGYIRIIDFGFSKRVPYTKKDGSGVVKVLAKTYTLCGTPEYLSPELIFNLGHNHASDLWALGVIIYEMFMAVTPFAPKTRPDNVTELFTNIALVKKNGLTLSTRLDQQSKSTSARELISALLRADPSERLGIQQGSSKCILDHVFFSKMDTKAVLTLKANPPFKPSPSVTHEPLANLPAVRPYHGDQKIFADF